jgi:predicted ABC-type transport system involved in lysophospholipase L1 biosynthesis ATPase subunit
MLTAIQRKRGMTLVIVTHENEIASAAPRHIRIRDGRIFDDRVLGQGTEA